MGHDAEAPGRATARRVPAERHERIMSAVRRIEIARPLGLSGRLGLVALAVAGLGRGDATVVALAVVFLVGSLAIARFARPGLDACLAALFVAHGWGVLLGPANTVGAWGPVLHVLAPTLVAMTIALAVADAGPTARRSPATALGAALAGGVLIIVGWEATELALTRISGVEIHTERGDTIADLALGLAGIIAGLALAWPLLRRRTRRREA